MAPFETQTIILYDHKEIHTYHFHKNWLISDPSADAFILPLSGSGNLSSENEVLLRSGKTFMVHGSGDGLQTADFEVTADENGLITIPEIYSGFDSYYFSLQDDENDYHFTFTKSLLEPEIPDEITINSSKSMYTSDGQETRQFVLNRTGSYSGILTSRFTDAVFTEEMPQGWHAPVPGSGPEHITVTENGDDFDVEINNAAERELLITGQVEVVPRLQEVTFQKIWQIPRSKIAFDIRSAGGGSGKVSGIEIRLTDGTLLEKIPVTGGAAVSSGSYETDCQYLAILQFNDGSTQSITVNENPFQKPDIMLQIDDEGDLHDLILNEENHWQASLLLHSDQATVTETTIGEWSYEVTRENGIITITNTVSHRIPVITAFTPPTVNTPQTGIHPDCARKLPDLLLLFSSASILTVFLKRQRPTFR